DRRARFETPGNRDSEIERRTFKISLTADCAPFDRDESQPARRRRYVAGVFGRFGSCSWLVPFLVTCDRKSNGAVSRSVAESKHSHPRSSARPHLQFSDRSQGRLAASVCGSGPARQGGGN